MKNKNFSFEKLLDEVISEMSADGGVAGYASPLGDETNRKLFKKESDESDDKSKIDKIFKAGDYEITRSWIGDKKGYTLMVKSIKGNGKEFLNDKKVQNIVDYLNKGG